MKFLWFFGASFWKSTINRSSSSLLLNEESSLKVVGPRQKLGAHQCPGLVRNISHGSAILNYYPDPGGQLIPDPDSDPAWTFLWPLKKLYSGPGFGSYLGLSVAIEKIMLKGTGIKSL
jgi:hypothetical protein